MKIIYGVENPWWANVSPETTGIGGSEEANLYLRRELIALGHDVTISDRLDEPCDIFVSWRNSFRYNLNAKKNYLHCHDIGVEPHWNPDAINHFDKIILLNEHHRNRYGVPTDRAFVCGNGVDLKQFDQAVGRKIGKCIFFSHPSRGLHQLRQYWPKIREACPYAELHAFWWEPEHFMEPNEAIGIMPMRNLGHMELAHEILSADIFSYPSTFGAEINPISCIKAQVGGAWPVVVIAGGMVDTIQFGDIVSHEEFADRVIKVIRDDTEHHVRRKQMMEKSRERYDWTSIAKIWSEEFEKELSK